MSLVVAQLTENGPRIVSDSKTRFLDGRNSAIKTGTLKSVILSPETVISFAGEVEAGLRGVRQAGASITAGIPIEKVISSLGTLTSEPSNRLEFIVARTDRPLIRIRSGAIESDLEVAWIGSQRAFERFQAERLRPVSQFYQQVLQSLTPGQRVCDVLTRSMDAVIADSKIPEVGDFCIRVAPVKGGFNYLEGTFMEVGRDFKIENGDNLISKMAQPVEEGGYAVSIVEPSKPGTPALGLSFPRAKLGMIFLPLQFDEAQVLHNVTARDFAKVVKETYGIEMGNPILREKTAP